MVKSYSENSPREPDPESCSSEVVRERQELFFDAAAQMMGFVVPKAGEAYDPALFAPKEWVAPVLKAWREGTPSPRQLMHAKIYDDAHKDNDTVKRHDPAIMRMADAMVDEYLWAYYWEDKAFAGILSSDDSAYKISRAAENVRAHTSAHYANVLFEQGYNTQEVDKIIRSVNRCFMQFMETQFKMEDGHARPGISPFRDPDTTPETSVRNIRLYPQDLYKRYYPER